VIFQAVYFKTDHFFFLVKASLGGGSRDMCIELSEFAEKHQIHPPIAKTFKFEEADKAIEALRKFSGVGKIVVEA
jgi:D-arabinose 1-dehydrogenase-like Zn-dependent alcohol dehydrogenase